MDCRVKPGNDRKKRSPPRLFAHHDFEKLLDLALLLGLPVDPIADQLLFGAHVVHQTLDRLGEVGHGGGSGLARAALIDGLAQLLDRAAHFERDAGGVFADLLRLCAYLGART